MNQGAGTRSRFRAAVLRTLLFAAASALSLLPALRVGELFASRYDWRYFEAMGEMSRRAVLWWHQAPLWNPYSCGGEVGLANPQSLDAAPTFLLVLLFGTALGYKLGLALYTFFALDGTFRLGRRLGLSGAASLLAAFGYGLSGYMALRFPEGHVTFIGVTLYPYLLLAFDHSLDELAWVVPTALCAAWIVCLGGTFTPPMAGELLVAWATMKAIERRSLRPYGLLAGAGALALCCSAIRMLPVLEFIHDHPRPPFMRAVDHTWPWQLVWDLVAWRKFGPLDAVENDASALLGKPLGAFIGHAFARKYWSHEYTARLPYGLLPLWLYGLWLPWSKRLAPPRRTVAREVWILTIVAALFTMGNFSPVAPWSLLQRLPVLRDLRVPSRHVILVVLGLSLLAGFAWDALVAWAVARRGERARRLLHRTSIALVALVAADGALFTALHYRDVFGVSLSPPDPSRGGPPRFFQVHGSWRSMRETLFAGRGSIDTPGSKDGPGCDEEAPLQRAEALDPGDVPQERLLDPGAGEVLASRFSPNRREITVRLGRPTVLLVNSNWNEHWKVDSVEPHDGEASITRVAGRLSVDLSRLPPGTHTVTLRYAPRSFVAGAAITLVSLPASLFCFCIAAWRRRRRSAAAQARATG